MKTETKNCQNCKKDFTIEPEDFNFYEKIKVPPPTFCPECRMQRRMVWRNERTLYKRICDLCKKNIIAMYDESAPFPVYCRECWYGDNWDASIYGREYDFSKTFFDQMKELSRVVPRLALWQRNLINSDYTNMSAESKNVYLSVSIINSENIFYSKGADESREIVDSYNVKMSENCYENIQCEKNYNCQYCVLSRNCIDSYFLIDCVNCSNCIMSSNLRNKQFYIRNQQYSKESYFKLLLEINLESRQSRQKLLREFFQMCNTATYRFANILKSNNSTGNNLSNTDNARFCFDGYDLENIKYCYRAFSVKDCMDFDYGIKSELMYEYTTGALDDFNVKFSVSALDNVRDSEYTELCTSGNNLFGCISFRNKSNSILNKVYEEKEFINLREKIINNMNEHPYIDKNGREYKYGEFFPIEISPFAYNETAAQDFFPLSKEDTILKGYNWKQVDSKTYKITVPSEKISDHINEVSESILDEVLGCKHKQSCNHSCYLAFKLTKDEFQFYKKNSIPIPDLCSNCRFYERFEKIPLPKLWHRKCMNEGCQNEFETPYAPSRPERVYCESCYNKEIY